MNSNQEYITNFFDKLSCDIRSDKTTLMMYATDASVYKEYPLAVAFPKNKQEIKELVSLCSKFKIPMIPRTAGTSLAGQVVGRGVVIDFSRYMRRILQFNEKEKWVVVEPGVVLDELNKFLAPYNLFFAPETSTSNRCMIGGMIANNSCGAHSILYGSTRDHVLEITAILSDTSEVVFRQISKNDFYEKCKLNDLEGKIYRKLNEILSNKDNQIEIQKQYPDKSIKRRNTGYALDILLETEIFSENKEKFNLCKLLCGSEGTLCIFTEIKLNLLPLPPKEKGLLCVHTNTLEDALKANLVALKYKPASIELIDKVIIECTKDNLAQKENRFFIKGEPEAILIIEFISESLQEINNIVSQLTSELCSLSLGYHYPLLTGKDINRVWELRKAGLGLLSNVPGDRKPVPVIEDTAVDPVNLLEYIKELKEILRKYNLECVFYAHIATGELHLRPILNLKDPDDIKLFKIIAREVAVLVKKYKGSLSGEHGDGRLRSEFISLVLGEKVYKLLREIKYTFDPDNIFNPGKIVDSPSITDSLRYYPGQKCREFKTYYDFSDTQGFQRAVEKCNGSADCRRTIAFAGLMCPTYQATLEEYYTTRARANVIREIFSNPNIEDPFLSEEIYNILNYCLSCKGCKKECPSSVDMAKLKSEFLQHYYERKHLPLQTWLTANITKINKIGLTFYPIYNFLLKNEVTSKMIKSILGFHNKRNLPTISSFSLNKWYNNNKRLLANNNTHSKKNVVLFVDEFTNYIDVEVGISTILLLSKLGYNISYLYFSESGRTYISKGLLKKAKSLCNYNINNLSELINEKTPLVGIEPSAILTFKDEYIYLCNKELIDNAKIIAKNTFTIDEFLIKEFEKGVFSRNIFTQEKKKIILHGHCHQKALLSIEPTKKFLEIPENYQVEVLNTSCCGMAGSFGYEKDKYELSQKIAEMILFPAIRNTKNDDIIVAPGTSCRTQIFEGTGRKAYHPVQVIYNALLV